MPKRKKAVQDKYYFLAKEQGYRARSCFKLIQLNRKYGLLENSQRVIDLCAAPGGWLQVCAKTMKKTPETQIIGVDLLPIRALRGVVTFEADITTPRCRQIIKAELKGKKADLVMCDGAPNVGADYTKDAFVQSELALCALRFATDHLVKGGSFVTKVFRSSDYNALLWVFQQFFKKVGATKPPSSRNVSAEIFVVCQHYLAPDKIDPKLLDPKHVFHQIEEDKEAVSAKLVNDLFNSKTKKKRNRSGYDDSLGPTLRRTNTISDFVAAKDPLRYLAESSAFTWDSSATEVYGSHAATTPEIRTLASDLKVIDKGEFRTLLRWRTNMVKYTARLAAAAAEEAEDGEDEEEDEGEEEEEIDEEEREKQRDAEMDEEFSKLQRKAAKKLKREKKRKARERARMQRRKDMGIENEGMDGTQEGVFSLAGLGVMSKADLELVSEVKLNDVDSSAVPVGKGFDSANGGEGYDFEVDGTLPETIYDDEAYTKRLENDAENARVHAITSPPEH